MILVTFSGYRAYLRLSLSAYPRVPVPVLVRAFIQDARSRTPIGDLTPVGPKERKASDPSEISFGGTARAGRVWAPGASLGA